MTNLAKDRYTEIVGKYQTTYNEKYVEKMINYLNNSLSQMTYKHLNTVMNYGYSYADVYNLGLQELWKAMKSFNGSKGSDFLSYFSKTFQWKVNDEFMEKRSGKAYNLMYAPVSVEHVIEAYNTDEVAIDMGVMKHFVAEDKGIEQVNSLLTYKHLLNKYVVTKQGQGKAEYKGALNDKELLTKVIEAIELGYEGQRDINVFLYNAFPEKSKGSIRQNKNRAYQRFGAFIKENS